MVRFAILFAAAALFSCSRNESAPSAAKEARTTPSAAAHAPAGARPGSHEDWCAEHDVPESMCTRCDPSLIAAFKAIGDWCAEHGLPESQCLACNPNLKIARPAAGGK
ncbi:MAG: hypothetical protein FJ087_07120 [Deltaproteobacteria bacterium]|nr:hypothetical protein [Deltaproteobacteria bacterium]